MNETNDPKTPQNQDDHVFRFALKKRTCTDGYDDPLVEMVRAYLADFLNIGFLTADGKHVRVNGFKFINDPDTVYDIFPENVLDKKSA